MTTAGQVRAAIAGRLREAGLEAVEAYESERFREGAEAVIAVGAKQTDLRASGLMSYLGERLDRESGCMVEVYGRELKMTVSLDAYAPRKLGARGCEQAAEKTAEALLDALPDGLRMEQMSWGATEWDKDYGMFVRRGTASCTAYFVAQTDEKSAVLTDFILKGVMQ